MTLKLLVQEISYRTRNIVSLIFLFKKKHCSKQASKQIKSKNNVFTFKNPCSQLVSTITQLRCIKCFRTLTNLFRYFIRERKIEEAANVWRTGKLLTESHQRNQKFRRKRERNRSQQTAQMYLPYRWTNIVSSYRNNR